MTTTFDDFIIQDGTTLTILNDKEDIQTIINKYFINNTITKIEIKTHMKSLNLSKIIRKIEIDCCNNTINRLYTNKCDIVNLSEKTLWLSKK